MKIEITKIGPGDLSVDLDKEAAKATTAEQIEFLMDAISMLESKLIALEVTAD